MPLTHSQTFAIDLTEKVGSVVSLLGAAFIITTFIADNNFRKPINRLIFYASWGNILSNVATLIGTSAIGHGKPSPLCRFQGLMIQWFLLVDALWAFCMALNVYLSFFHQYGAVKLRRLEWKYAIACYGLPAICAIAFCFLRTDTRGSVYGDAVLWCWISIHWDFLRIVTFYGPAWIIILLTMAIYIRVGCLIQQWRSQLRPLDVRIKYEEQRERRNLTPTFGIRRTDEVTITTETMLAPLPAHHFLGFRQPRCPAVRGRRSFSDSIFLSRRRTRSDASQMAPNAAGTQTNKAAIQYCKCAILFFLALLCTWVPSSINRIYTLIHPDQTPFAPAYAAGLVLPLQGFWNFVVYVTTSQWACKSCWKRSRSKFCCSKDRPARTMALQQQPAKQRSSTLVHDDDDHGSETQVDSFISPEQC